MDRDEVSPGTAQEQSVEQGPVGDGAASVCHALGADVRVRHATGTEVVAREKDGRRQLAVGDEPVDLESKPRALAVAEPAAARRKALHRDVRAREVDPFRDLGPLGKQIVGEVVQPREVRLVTAQRDPAERTDAAREQRPHVAFRETVDGEGVLDSGVCRLDAQVVPVLDRDGAPLLEREDRAHLGGHRLPGHRHDLGRIGVAQANPFFEGHSLWHVAVQRVVRRRQVGHDVRRDPPPGELREDVRRVAQKAEGGAVRKLIPGRMSARSARRRLRLWREQERNQVRHLLDRDGSFQAFWQGQRSLR